MEARCRLLDYLECRLYFIIEWLCIQGCIYKKGSGKRLWECRNASMSDVEHYSCIPCSKMQHVENRGTVFPALPPHFTVGCVNSKLPNLVIDYALFYCATLHINS